jgi:glycoprotein endo-alpha-1,2-mannosidase
MKKGVPRKMTNATFLFRLLVCLGAPVVVCLVGDCLAEQGNGVVEPKVLAFYYTWYGNPQVSGRWVHWRNDDSDFSLLDGHGLPFARATNHPAIGLYDSTDPLVIAGHLKLADKAGIDAFIATWWGQGDFTDVALKALLDVADAIRPKTEVSVYYETIPDKDPQRVIDDLLYIIRNYGDRESFLRVEGIPVLFIYGRAIGQLTATQWGQVAAAVKKEEPVLLIADTDSGIKPDKADFDGFHFYNPVGRITRGVDMGGFYGQYTQQYRAPGKIVCLTVIPGYDDTNVRQPGTAVSRDNGQLYERLWSSAVAANPHWILITSWNEWHEGSEIEPSIEHGRLYLDMTAAAVQTFKQGAKP